jgi:hypothetical protein
MSNIIAFSIAISFGCLATYHTNDSLTTFSYLKAAALSILIYVPIQFTWTCFLWPLYFSPLRKLPQAPVWFLIVARNIYSDISLANWGMEKLLQHNKPSTGLGIHGYRASWTLLSNVGHFQHRNSDPDRSKSDHAAFSNRFLWICQAYEFQKDSKIPSWKWLGRFRWPRPQGKALGRISVL